MRMVAAETLERVTRDIFAGWRAPREDAAWVAALLVRANLRGHDSHGVIRIPSYVAGMKSGDTNAMPQLAVVMETPSCPAIRFIVVVRAMRALVLSPSYFIAKVA